MGSEISPRTRSLFLIPFHVKITVLVSLVVIGTVSAVAWKTRAMVLKDKLGFLADAAMKQTAPLKRLVDERLNEEKNKLTAIASSHGTKAVKNGDFEIVSLVQNAPAGQWTPMWVEKSQKAEALPQSLETTLLKSLPYNRVKDGDTIWARLSDQNGAPVYAILLSAELKVQGTDSANQASVLPETTDYASNPSAPKKVMLVGLTRRNPLAGVTEDYIGSTNVVYIVDDKGYVASHVNRSYQGSLFSEDPLVQEIVSTKKTAASGTFEDIESRSVLGHFEKIDRTNLYAVITTPLASVQDFMDALLKTIAISALSVGAIGILLAYLVSRTNANNGSGPLVESRGTIITEPLSSVLQTPVPVTSDVAMDLRASYESFTKGCVGAINEPLLAILGHAQLAEAKTQDEEVRSHAASIEREARKVKDVLEKLGEWNKLVGAAATDDEIDLMALIASEMKHLEPSLKEEGIKLELDLHVVPRVKGSSAQIRTVIQNLVENAREALAARSPKILRVHLDLRNDAIVLVVSDNGVGMSRDVKERAFEPFFKNFVSPKRAGLGLSAVQEVSREMGGSAEIESTPGDGASVSLSFPVSASALDFFRSEQAIAIAARLNSDLHESSTVPLPPPILQTKETSKPPPVSAPPPATQTNSEAELVFQKPTMTLPKDLGFISDPSETSEIGKTVLMADTHRIEIDADDIDDEIFTSLDLHSKSMKSNPIRPPLPDPLEVLTDSTGGPGVDPSGEFKVKIRRPRARS